MSKITGHGLEFDIKNISKTQCECAVCARHRKIEEIIKRRDVNELISILQQCENQLFDTEFDLDYYKLVANGKWHCSVEILERWLQNAKEVGKMTGKTTG